MLTEVPFAQTYYLNPLKKSLPEIDRSGKISTRIFESDKLIEVGGVGVMNEVGFFLSDSQIVLIMGVSNDKCLLFVNITDVECVDILNKARLTYDVKAGRVLNAPTNG